MGFAKFRQPERIGGQLNGKEFESRLERFHI